MILVIRFVEQRHREGNGRPVEGNVDEAQAAQALKKAITEARKARVPTDVASARAVIDQAYAIAAAATRGGVRSQRPANWGLVA